MSVRALIQDCHIALRGGQVAVVTSRAQKLCQTVADTTQCTLSAPAVLILCHCLALRPGISVSYWESNPWLTCHRTIPATQWLPVSLSAIWNVRWSNCWISTTGPPVCDCLPWQLSAISCLRGCKRETASFNKTSISFYLNRCISTAQDPRSCLRLCNVEAGQRRPGRRSGQRRRGRGPRQKMKKVVNKCIL